MSKFWYIHIIKGLIKEHVLFPQLVKFGGDQSPRTYTFRQPLLRIDFLVHRDFYRKNKKYVLTQKMDKIRTKKLVEHENNFISE